MSSDAAIAELSSLLQGNLIEPGDGEYETARSVWNGMIDRRPALIARCLSANDVSAAVRFAESRGLHVSVRGGGHNVSGSAIVDGGLVVDLSQMRGVRVDPARSTVRVEGGARLGDVDRETQAVGLAVPVGIVSATGIGGLSLHGGMGFLTRRLGLTSDSLIAAEVVTGDGQIRAVDRDHDPDLLWALRGGGGVGAVTSFEFRAHPVGPDVWMAIVMYPADEGPRILPFFRDFMANAPDELMGLAIYWSAPHGEPIPPEHQGAPVFVLAGCWSGPPEKGEEAIRPLREQGTPIADLSGPMPYLEAQRLFDPEYPDGRRYYWKSIFLPELSEGVIAVMHESAARRPSPISSIDVWALGGAMGRIDPKATAFFRRDQPFLVGIEANWIEPADDEANLKWLRDLYGELKRFSNAGAYFNFPGFVEEGDRLVRDSYGENYDRLAEIQRRYDPKGLFRPTMGGSR
jgi:hypothetical protein